MDFTATDTAELTNISVRSINSIFIKIHHKIAQTCEEISPIKGVNVFSTSKTDELPFQSSAQ